MIPNWLIDIRGHWWIIVDGHFAFSLWIGSQTLLLTPIDDWLLIVLIDRWLLFSPLVIIVCFHDIWWFDWLNIDAHYGLIYGDGLPRLGIIPRTLPHYIIIDDLFPGSQTVTTAFGQTLPCILTQTSGLPSPYCYYLQLPTIGVFNSPFVLLTGQVFQYYCNDDPNLRHWCCWFYTWCHLLTTVHCWRRPWPTLCDGRHYYIYYLTQFICWTVPGHY